MTHYDYTASKAYAEAVGLVWMEELVYAADQEAFELGFNQHQVNAAMRHHLWQVAFLFNPKTYSWGGRLFLALHFIFNPRKK